MPKDTTDLDPRISQLLHRVGVVSLWRLLEMMKGASPLLTKARYVELHDNDVHHRRAAASHWDRVVTPGHDAIPPATNDVY